MATTEQRLAKLELQVVELAKKRGARGLQGLRGPAATEAGAVMTGYSPNFADTDLSSNQKPIVLMEAPGAGAVRRLAAVALGGTWVDGSVKVQAYRVAFPLSLTAIGDGVILTDKEDPLVDEDIDGEEFAEGEWIAIIAEGSGDLDITGETQIGASLHYTLDEPV